MHAAIVLAPLAALAMFYLAGSALGQAADDAVLFKEDGKASYYGGQFHGRPTASGEPFDQNAMTAAHPKLPLGSEVTVTDPATGKQVEVEVNDRGPYVDGRAIDLSQAMSTGVRSTCRKVLPTSSGSPRKVSPRWRSRPPSSRWKRRSTRPRSCPRWSGSSRTRARPLPPRAPHSPSRCRHSSRRRSNEQLSVSAMYAIACGWPRSSRAYLRPTALAVCGCVAGLIIMRSSAR